MEIKSADQKLKQDQLAKELGFSSSNLRRYRNDMNTLSPNKIPPYSYKKDRRTQMWKSLTMDITKKVPKDLKRPQMASKNVI